MTQPPPGPPYQPGPPPQQPWSGGQPPYPSGPPPAPQPWPQPAGPPPQWAQPGVQPTGAPTGAPTTAQWAQRPPQQQWPAQPHQPAAQAGPPGPTLGTHLKRAFNWNLAEVVVTPKEQQQLHAAGVEPRLHGMLAWRRSTLIAAMPLLLLSVVLAFYDTIHTGTDGLTGLGKFCDFVPDFALLLIPIGAMRVIATWTEMRRNARMLILFWVLSIVVPLMVALLPLDALVDLDTPRQQVIEQGGDVAAFDTYIRGVRAAVAVAYAMTLLPVVITIPSGVLKGAARMKSLFPAAALPGWFLIAVAPFYSLFTIVVFVLIEQMVGNGLLVVGVGLLAFSPWLFVIYRKVYGRPMSMAEAATELPRASRYGGMLMFGALGLLTIYVLTAKVNGRRVVGSGKEAYFSYTDVLRAVGEVISRTMVTTVVFSAIVLSMVFAEWRVSRSVRPEIREEHDTQMRAIERYMTSPTAPPQATWATGPTS